MKNLMALTMMILFFSSCDPVADMEANIENLTSQDLTIDFVSSDTSLNKTLQIPSNELALFQVGFDIGSTFLEPSLVEYDSVVIIGQLGNIVKVYKENGMGKNIYNIDDYWMSSEPSKRSFKYEYEIENEDIK